MASLSPFFTAKTTASTSTSFTAKIPTATEPSGDGIIKLTDTPYGQSCAGYAYAHLIPFGTDGNNDTFDMRVWGWRKVSGATLYIPFKLLDISVVLGNISGAAVGTNVTMPDTITLNKGIPAGIFSALLNMADDTTGGIMVHLLGAQYIEFDFDLAGAQEAVSMNCYFALLNP